MYHRPMLLSLLLVAFLSTPSGAAFEEDLPCDVPPRVQAEILPPVDTRVENALRAYAIMRRGNMGWKRMQLVPEDVMRLVLLTEDASYDHMRAKAPQEDVDNLRERLEGGAKPVGKVVELLTQITSRCLAESRTSYLDEVTAYVCLVQTNSQLSMFLKPDPEADRRVLETPY